MNNCDLILHLVEQLITEKEKNILLQQENRQQKPVQDNKNVKTKM